MHNLNSVVKKQQKITEFNKLRNDEIAYQNEQRQKHHMKVQMKVELARKQNRRNQILQFRKVK